MEYKRAFLFGCSWTSFSYPTWANIMQKDLDIPVYNWGWSGTGNVAIQHRMVQCDLLNKFTEHDLIIPLWSSWTREDRYEEEGWYNVGSVLNQPPGSKYNKTFVRNHWRWENDVVKNATAIITANKMFPIWKNFSIAPIDDDSALYDFYQEHLPKIHVWSIDKSSHSYQVDDDHPSIMQHMKFIKKEIYADLKITMQSSTEESVNNYQLDLDDQLAKLQQKYKSKVKHKIFLHVANSLWEKHNFKKHPQFDWNGGSLNPELFKRLK